MLTLLTATGARPAAWAICERLMAAQDYAGPVRWLVVDDGPEAQPIAFERAGWTVEVIRPVPIWQPGQNTQARNLLAGLAVIDDDSRLAVIEDDDWYSPDWLSHVDQQLDLAELVGERRARYYNVEFRRGRQLSNTEHASLCSSAMRGRAIAAFRAACLVRPKFIDLELWRRHPFRFLFDGGRVVGIKGLPGRAGIGMGHRDDFTGQADRDGALLSLWVGEDAELYA
ncbi:glycosyltransferase family A protein [Lysobacter sp. Root96]|uniref:glycosyltransferase family A protein n=1 Tax=Lysobacter sp. Root96 TaxID=1736612 RepID=UPI0007021AE1|nr:glycosyltransferase family A protein [Lysobacter sp. Root96]KRD71446.1 hypothetical protein ASE45_06455 [Lysobacter sp. Root96]